MAMDVSPYKLPMKYATTVNWPCCTTEIMQDQGASVANFKTLCTAARMPVPKPYESTSIDQLKAFVRNGLQKGQTVAVPLAWD
jgi:hypothetical protein